MADAKKSGIAPNQWIPWTAAKNKSHFVKRKKYRSIPRGAGGTLVIDNRNGGIKRIGTVGCQWTLGVFFRIDDQRVFCAHMTVSDLSIVFSKARGEELRDRVCSKLQSLATTEGWAVKHEQFGVAMILICRRLLRMSHRGTEEEKTASWWMAEGVRKFMEQCLLELSSSNIPDTEEELLRLNRHWRHFRKCVNDLKVNQDGAGVVVDVGPEVEVVIMEPSDGSPFNLDTGEVDPSSFVQKDETKGVGQWYFSLDINLSPV